jgi:hypothetical protein
MAAVQPMPAATFFDASHMVVLPALSAMEQSL